MTKLEHPQLIQFTPDEEKALDLMENAYFEAFSNLVLKNIDVKTLKEKTADLYRARDPIIKKASLRTIETYHGDTTKIYKDLTAAVEEIINGITDGAFYKDSISNNRHEHMIKAISEAPIKAYKYFFEYLETEAEHLHRELIAYINERTTGATIKPEDITPTDPPLYLALIDKASRRAFRGELSNGECDPLKMERKGSTPITSYVTINYSNIDGYINVLCPLDKSVYQAIIQYLDDGQCEATPAMINARMTGNPNARITEARAKDIHESIMRMATTVIEIDVGDEIAIGKYKFERPVLSGNLLAYKLLSGYISGNYAQYYRFSDTAVLYEYAKSKNQITSVPADVMRIQTVRMTNDTIPIRDYLIEFVQELKNPKNPQDNNIRTYEKMFKDLSIGYYAKQTPGKSPKKLAIEPPPEAEPKEAAKIKERIKKEQQRAKQHVADILRHWENIGYIKGFKADIKKGRAIHSFKIIL